MPRFAVLLGLSILLALNGCVSHRARTSSLAAPASVSSRSAPIQFHDVAADLGLDFHWGNGGKHPLNILEIMGAGAAFLDYDQDGWPDILLIGNDQCALYHNEGGKRFRNVTAGSGLDRLTGRWHGCAVADYNGDSLPDVFLTGYRRKRLLRNVSAGRFAPVDIPDLNTDTWGSAASFLDANGDGFLDLIVGNYVRFGPGSPEFMDRNGVKITLGPDAYEAEKLQLLLNRRGEGFRDATRGSGIEVSRGRCLGMAVADFDSDGDDDFYVANDEMPGNLFQNDGKGKFRDVGVVSGTALSVTGKRQGGMGVSWADYDNDLRSDLLVTTFTQEPKSLYHNDDGQLFSERSYAAGISQSTLRWVGFGIRFLDADHDGDLDLAMANGHVEDLIRQVDPLNDYPQPLKFFLNEGNGTFVDATDQAGSGFSKRIVGRALATADFDLDGDMDLLAADLEGAPVLLRNEGGNRAGNWLILHLQGKSSNSMALGARVEIRVGSARQMREVRTDGSYLAAHDPGVHFGVGQAAQVDEIQIRWPGGATQRLANIKVNQRLRVREP